MIFRRRLSFRKLIVVFTSVVACCYVVAMGTIWFLTFHPKDVQAEIVFNKPDTPVLRVGQEIKVMTWNIQYMAGKNYVFFYDVADGKGPHSKPLMQDVAKTFQEVVRIIKENNPDIILLQEVDSGAKRTYYEDQLHVLMGLLPDDYKSYCSTYYWKNKFNPHPKILGSTGLKLAIISKYKIVEATRHQLSCLEWTSIFKDFSFKRAILKARLPVEEGKDFFAINTHLSAFSQGTDNMKKQVSEIMALLEPLENEKSTWVIGGDFNLLPPGQYEILIDPAKYYYQPETELLALMEKYPCIPQLEDCQCKNSSRWYTHFSNDPQFTGPDRTIDYIFYSKHFGNPLKYEVLNDGTLHISDHFPLVSTFQLPDREF